MYVIIASICDGWTCDELNVIKVLDRFKCVINQHKQTAHLFISNRGNYKCMTSNQWRNASSMNQRGINYLDAIKILHVLRYAYFRDSMFRWIPLRMSNESHRLVGSYRNRVDHRRLSGLEYWPTHSATQPQYSCQPLSEQHMAPAYRLPSECTSYLLRTSNPINLFLSHYMYL